MDSQSFELINAYISFFKYFNKFAKHFLLFYSAILFSL